MRAVIDAFALQLVLAALTGWLDRQEHEVLRYLIEENRLQERPAWGDIIVRRSSTGH